MLKNKKIVFYCLIFIGSVLLFINFPNYQSQRSATKILNFGHIIYFIFVVLVLMKDSQWIKKLSKSPVKFASLTKGSRLQGELAEIFAHHGTWLRISIDGWDKDSYADYRGVSNDEFSKVINNIKNFKGLGGKCYLGISLMNTGL